MPEIDGRGKDILKWFKDHGFIKPIEIKELPRSVWVHANGNTITRRDPRCLR
jgi:N-acetylglutamate synthase-like GNAT family acetyltransferase